MKRFIFTIVILLATVAARASRAYSEPFTVSQPDGTQLTIILHGDEHQSWLTTTDGVIVLETKQGYYVASISDNGRLATTRLMAHQPAQRSSEEQQACQRQQQRQSLFLKQVDGRRQSARRAHVTDEYYFPHSDSPKCLAILVNFSDVSFTSENPYEQFNQYLNGETQENLGHNEQKNLVGVKRYFETSSQGKFTPQFDVVGPVTLPETQDFYGRNEGDTHDINFNQFCQDAIAAVDTLVDFRNYDNSHDGNVELVCIIYAGCGESVGGNPSNTIWPKCGYKNIETKDRVTVGFVNCSPELRAVNQSNINGIGVFCHEFSHGMGLPDLYVTESSAMVNNQSPEFWDLMDYGEYADNGYAPVPYSVWEQEAMGWIEVEQLSDTQTGIELKPLVQGGKAYKFGNGASDEEWMMIENVQPRVTSEPHLPGSAYGHGLLVWHIAYAYDTVNMGDYPNNTAHTPRVCIVPADSLVINGYLFGDGRPYSQADYVASLRGDPFPGTSKVTMLTAGQLLPNYRFYDGEEIPRFRLANITEDEATGVITFDFINEATDALNPITVRPHLSTADYYTLDGRCMGSDYRRLPKGIYVRKGLKVIKSVSDPTFL